MPNRIIREGILTSDRIDRLGSLAELFYRRLMNVVDDFGRFDARPSLLRASLFPLRIDKVREADISRWLAEVQSAGLIALYVVDNKKYLQLLDFRQQMRAKASKYPAPSDEQMRSACVADDAHVRTKAESYAESESETEARLVLPDDLDKPELREAWEAFIAHRKEIKKELTKTAAGRFFVKFRKWGPKASIEGIEKSIACRWTNIWPKDEPRPESEGFKRRQPAPEEVA